MPLTLRDCTFFGSALSESFALNDLEAVLAKEKLLEKLSGDARRELEEGWESYRRKLRALGDQGGALRVRHHILDPLAERLGYGPPQLAGPVRTREDEEDGGFLYATADGAKLRAWAVDLGTDLDAPNQRGRAYRFSPSRVAERVLLATGERVGLLTDGEELRVVLVDPARPGSHVAVALGRSGGWRGAAAVPDSYRLVRALASPGGVAKIGAITDAARLAQTRVTKSLRDQARWAVEGFVQGLLDHPANAPALAEWTDREALARTLWREGLVVVYRLLFVLKLEASADPARAFSFASTTLWRNTYSPNVALAPVVKDVVERGAETGSFLADSLRATFRLFSEGLSSSELKVSPLGGMLFGPESAPLVSRLTWTEQGVAALLDNLFWTRERGQDARARVHYGSLDVEDLGRVYEALLELEPGIAERPMCRLRRAKLEVIVDAATGEAYREAARPGAEEPENNETGEDAGDDEAPQRGKAKTVWVDDIAKGRFFLRVGLGRKATGSYYTPHPFVRYLVQETLGPQVSERSPADDPKPGELLKLKVLDPAMGSGHFLVEACRFLGEKMYEATRLCDGLAADVERAAAVSKDAAERERLLGRARELRQRVEDLPDPNDELVAYLPSRAAEGGESGLSQSRALAICRRLVAVHCLYGVDKNPLAVELAKVSLWLESYAEGLPLTFLDHRLVCGDSLTAPFFRHLMTDPVTGRSLEGLFLQRLGTRLTAALGSAVQHVRDLEASVGKDAADLERKRAAKTRLDEALSPFRTLSQVWSGVARLAAEGADSQGWEEMLNAVADGAMLERVIDGRPALRAALAEGKGCAPYEFLFPEVFFPGGDPAAKGGFDSVVGNPPWDKPRFERKEFLGSFFLSILESQRSSEWEREANALLASNPHVADAMREAEQVVDGLGRLLDRMYPATRGGDADVDASGDKDLYLYFFERAYTLAERGAVGLLVGGGLAKNNAAAGVRKLLVSSKRLSLLYQFVNLRRLFADLPPVVEFCLATLVPRAIEAVRVAAGLDDLTFASAETPLGEQVQFTEVASPAWLPRRSNTQADTEPLDKLLSSVGGLTRELDKTQDDSGFVSIAALVPDLKDARPWAATVALLKSGAVPLRGSRTFGVLNPFPSGLGGARSPRVELAVKVDYPRASRFLRRARYYRLGLRRHVGSIHTNERAVVACVFSPGVLCNDQIMVEGQPWVRPNSRALYIAGLLSAFTVEEPIRPLVGSMMSGTIIAQARHPLLGTDASRLVVHSALRLVACDEGYEHLWREQLDNEWRERGGDRLKLPVFEGDDSRWAVRAAIDAVVADAYGLDRAQFEHVLASFSHRSYPDAPRRSLEAYDELKRLGLTRFCQKHDPYFDIPLVETLPQPAIDLPVTAVGPVPLASAKAGRGARKPTAGQLPLGEFQLAAETVAPARRPKKKAR